MFRVSSMAASVFYYHCFILFYFLLISLQTVAVIDFEKSAIKHVYRHHERGVTQVRSIIFSVYLRISNMNLTTTVYVLNFYTHKWQKDDCKTYTVERSSHCIWILGAVWPPITFVSICKPRHTLVHLAWLSCPSGHIMRIHLQAIKCERINHVMSCLFNCHNWGEEMCAPILKRWLWQFILTLLTMWSNDLTILTTFLVLHSIISIFN